MIYQTFLTEAAAGSVEPRHVVVPLRTMLRHCRVITGAVTAITHADERARIDPVEGAPFEVSYDVLVMAPATYHVSRGPAFNRKARGAPPPARAEQPSALPSTGS